MKKQTSIQQERVLPQGLEKLRKAQHGTKIETDYSVRKKRTQAGKPPNLNLLFIWKQFLLQSKHCPVNMDILPTKGKRLFPSCCFQKGVLILHSLDGNKKTRAQAGHPSFFITVKSSQLLIDNWVVFLLLSTKLQGPIEMD